jgi:hypothetical protein
VVRCGSKVGHQKDMYLNDIGLYVQNMLNHSRLNGQHDWGGPCDHLMSMRTFTLIVDNIFI